MDIAALGLKVEGVIGLDKATSSLDDFTKSAKNATDGVSKVNNSLKPVKKQLEDAASATAKLTKEEEKLAKMAEQAGMSVNAMKAALRGVPAQFTDIAVSLQGGMSPLTVFLQQGGQLKDMFGGAGTAARALAGYIAGLINPLSVGAAAIAAMGVAYYQGSKEVDAFRVSLASTGNAIGLTTDNLTAYAQQISEVSGTQGKASEALNQFVQAGFRSTGMLSEFTQVAIQWESATGEAVEEVAEKFVALEKDPLKAALKLNEGINFLTVSIYSQIKALEDQGRSAEAAEIAMNAMASAMADRSKNIEENLGVIERGWKKVTGAAKGAWDAMLSIGRQTSLTERLVEEQEKLVKLESQAAGLYERGTYAKRVADQRARVQALQDEHAQTLLNAEADKLRAEQVENRVKWDKVVESNLSKQAKMERELAQARQAATDAGITGVELETQLSAIREKYAEKTKKVTDATKADTNAYKTFIMTLNQKIAATEKDIETGDKATDADRMRARLYEELNTRGRKLTATQVAEAESKIAQLEALDNYNAALKESEKALEDYAKKQQQALAKLDEQIEKLKLEEEGHKLAAELNITHAEAMERLTIARLEDARAQMQAGAGSDAEIARITLEIQKRKELLEVYQQKGAREAADKAFKEVEKRGEKAAKLVSDSLTSYIMSGGESAAEGLERLFANLVLQPQMEVLSKNISSYLNGGGGNPLAGNSITDWSTWGDSASWAAHNLGYMAGENGWTGLSDSLFGLSNSIESLDASISSIPGFEGGMGSVAGYATALFALSEKKYGEAVGAAIGTYIMPGIGTMIGSTLGGFVDSAFGSKNTPHAGAAAAYAGGQITGSGKQFARTAINADYSEGMQSAVNSLSLAIGSSLDGLAKTFDKNVQYMVTTGFKSDNDDPSNGTLQITTSTGEELVKWLAQRSGQYGSRATGYSYASDPEKGMDEYLKSVTAATIPVFKDIVPAWADAMLDNFSASIGLSGNNWKGITASGSDSIQGLTNLVQQIAAVEAAFESIGKVMPEMANATDELKTALLGAAGGSFDQMVAAINVFDSAFTTEAEKMRRVSEQLNAAFGIDATLGEEAARQYEQAVRDALSAGNAEIAYQMMVASTTFKQATDYFQQGINDVAQAAIEAADEARAALADSVQSSLSGAWSNLGAMASFGASHGSTYAAQEQLSFLRNTYSGNDATGRVTAIQQMVSLEQALWNAQEKSRKAEADAAQKRIAASREELQNANKLLSAAQNLREYAYGIFSASTSGLSDSARSEVLGKQYAEALAKANKGDAEALASLPSLSSDYMRLMEDSATSQAEYAVIANQMAHELSATGYKQEDVALTQIAKLERQISVAEMQLDNASKQFEVSKDTKSLIDSLVNQTVHNFSVETAQLGNMVSTGQLTVDLLTSMPSELGGVINAAIIPAMNGVAASISGSLSLAMGTAYNAASAARVDGSHATGLANVPFDGYIAELHKGEAVVPAAHNPFNGSSFGGNTDGLLRQLIDDNRNQAAALVRMQATQTRIIERWNLEGMPRPRDEETV